MKRDYVTTFAAEALVLASALLVYRMVAMTFGAIGFAEYAVARRSLTLFLPLCVLGLDVALPRLTAYAAELRPAAAQSYLLAALPIAATGLALTSVTIWLFPGLVAQLFFGSTEFIALAAVLPLMLAGATAHVLVYGYLRGRGRITQANILMIANHAGAPLVSALLLGGSIVGLLAGIGLAWILITCVAFALTRRSTVEVAQHTRDLVRTGIRRVPGDLVQLLFFALPVMITAQIAGLAEAGVVAFGITAIGMIGSSLTPIGFVLLPVASRSMGRGDTASIRVHISALLRILAPAVVAGVILLEIFAEPLVVGFVGEEFRDATETLRVILLGAVPWSAYILLRSVVDARHERAINARNMTIAFAVFVVLAGMAVVLRTGVAGVTAAFVVGLAVVGVLTVFEARRALRDAKIGSEVFEAPSETV